MSRIFVTGATGYVGGDFLALLQEKHPDYAITALVRSEAQREVLQSRFPGVHGVMIPTAELASVGTDTDIVMQIANSDDEAMSLALLGGLSNEPGKAYIHVSGIATLIDPLVPLGELDPRIYDDETQTEELLSLPDDRLHTAIEQKLVATAEASNARLAIVSLPRMHGRSRGLVPQSKVFEPYLRGVHARGKAFTVGAGLNRSSHSHVRDASAALLLIVEEALKGQDSQADWGRNGYYFVETGESAFVDEAKAISGLLQEMGLLGSTELNSLDVGDAAAIWEMGPIVWGGNSRCKANKLRKLGWNPGGIQPMETLRETISHYFAVSK